MAVTIYLIHFSARYKHAGHYLGSAEILKARLAAHRSGNGSRLMAVIAEAGIDWSLARTWENATREDEARLKCHQHNRRLCPLCNPQAERCGKLTTKEKAQ
jgi:hypothetical protein